MTVKATKKKEISTKNESKKIVRKKRIKKDEIENLKNELLKEKEIILKELASLDEVVLNNSSKDTNKDISGVSIHLADIGTDNQETETLLKIRERVEERLNQVETALNNINKGGYGICNKCHKAINIERLLAMPYTEFCINCMEALEKMRIS